MSDESEKLAKTTENKAVGAMAALGFVWEVLIAIAVPTILLALGGRWLDTRWNTAPWFSVIGLFLSLGIVLFLMTRKAKKLSALLKQPKNKS